MFAAASYEMWRLLRSVRELGDSMAESSAGVIAQLGATRGNPRAGWGLFGQVGAGRGGKCDCHVAVGCGGCCRSCHHRRLCSGGAPLDERRVVGRRTGTPSRLWSLPHAVRTGIQGRGPRGEVRQEQGAGGFRGGDCRAWSHVGPYGQDGGQRCCCTARPRGRGGQQEQKQRRRPQGREERRRGGQEQVGHLEDEGLHPSGWLRSAGCCAAGSAWHQRSRHADRAAERRADGRADGCGRRLPGFGDVPGQGGGSGPQGGWADRGPRLHLR